MITSITCGMRLSTSLLQAEQAKTKELLQDQSWSSDWKGEPHTFFQAFPGILNIDTDISKNTNVCGLQESVGI